ncbi:MAG: tRNA dimethylallyltransferase, partial [Hyphomicrobiales bacterium]|nr:tRNA dimethylallyltransferase [Hyphomicrobiales bacterium]
PVPEIPADVRAHWRDQAARVGAEGIFRHLQERDPVMAERLKLGDTQRITRALEVIDATGRSLAHWQSQSGTPLLDEAACVKIVAVLDREALYARLDQRFLAMLEAGALDEAAQLMAPGLDGSVPVMRAIGVRPLIRHLRGDCTLDAAIIDGQMETRRYAKRQMTWTKSNMITWNRLDT